MNSDRLLHEFDLLGDGPETVQQFRKLVVGLAMANKLTAAHGEASDHVALVKLINSFGRSSSEIFGADFSLEP
jgi:type I restriction enzyme, S subunit